MVAIADHFGLEYSKPILKPEPKAPGVNKLMEVGFVESPLLTERAGEEEITPGQGDGKGSLKSAPPEVESRLGLKSLWHV